MTVPLLESRNDGLSCNSHLKGVGPRTCKFIENSAHYRYSALFGRFCNANTPVLNLDASSVVADGDLVHDALLHDDASLLAAVAEVVVARAHVVIDARGRDLARTLVVVRACVIELGHLAAELY